MKKLATILLFFVFAASVSAEEKHETITVYKSPFCGCCTKWVKYMRKNGFQVEEKKIHNVQEYKEKYGTSGRLSSCHTSVVSGYVIEGHVPAEDVKRLLKEKPDIKGLTLPGMPTGAPGMEQDGQRDDFDVLAIKKDGSTFVYSSYTGN